MASRRTSSRWNRLAFADWLLLRTDQESFPMCLLCRVLKLNLLCVSALWCQSHDLGAQELRASEPVEMQAPPTVDDGFPVTWEDWSFRWAYRDIEGLVLTDVRYQNRQVLKYLGLAEIYVPYATGSPRPEDFSLGGFKGNPFPIQVGIDCYANGSVCQSFNRDGQLADGDTADMMMHEEETGFLYAGQRGRADGKVLVLWSMAHFPGPPGDTVNVDGYTYVIRWKFHNDGRIAVDVGSTGGLQHLNNSNNPARGHVVGKDDTGSSVFAPAHIHNFYFRVDLDVDGSENRVEEFNYVRDSADPMQARPTWTPLRNETGRLSNEETFRTWRVVNPKSLNAQGHPRSYQLVKRTAGAWRDGHSYWVLKGDFFATRYKPEEFPYSSTDSRRMLKALGSYVDGESLDRSDVLLWYRVSFAHQPRSEDWPAQPIVWCGFDLMPRDFLDHSPAQVVP